MTNMLQQILTRSVKESEVKSDSGSESAEWTEIDSPCFLTLLFLFLSPPKKFPIWSRRPGAFFLRPSPKAACAELLADAMVVLVGW